MRTILIIFLGVFIITSGCQSKNKIRKEILTKANTEIAELVDKAINSQTAGLGSLIVDNLITPEKKQKLIDDALLPKFRDFVNKTNDMDSLKQMNTDDTFRYKMILKSTIGTTSEEAIKALYEKIVNGDFSLNLK